MKKIVLLCASGMSTSMLVRKMKEAAAAEGYECSIDAFSASEAATKAADADVVLLGPQIRFQKNKIAEQVRCASRCDRYAHVRPYGRQGCARLCTQAHE